MDATTLNAILGAVSAGTTLLAAVTYYRNESHRRTLKKLQEFADGVATYEYVDTHVFVLGPRSAGKSSVVTAWIKIWMNIKRMPPTPIDFIEHEYIFPASTDRKEFDHDLGINVTRRTKARTVIYDYAGEDSALDSAVEKIANVKDYIVVFVMTAEPMKDRINGEYFNIRFLKKMRTALTRSEQPPPPCFVLLNKIDLVDHAAVKGEDALAQVCQEKNETALSNIKSIFGQPHLHYVSAESGEGISPFLRELSGYVVDNNGRPKADVNVRG